MKPQKKASFIRRWEKVQTEKAKLGLEEARLLAEIRNEFPNGNGGDLQFKEWCLDALGPVNSPLLLKKATASRVLGKHFNRLRDWKAATALMNFRASERRKILKAINATRPTCVITNSTIRTTGYRLGFRSSAHAGAPTTMELHQKVDLLIDWVMKLYAEYDLPAIPEDVRTALGTSSLAKAKHGLVELVA